MRSFRFSMDNGMSWITIGKLAGADYKYIIEKVSGIDEPVVSHQDQSAPFQDGSTYIDSLYKNREIVIDCAIKAPRNLTNIIAEKDILYRAFNPKNGQGLLQYTDGVITRYITAVPRVLIKNKDSREPFQKFQLVFLCNDPYWRETTAVTTNLVAPSVNAVVTINNSSTITSSIIEKQNGDLFVIYYIPYGNIYSRTYSGGSWGAESSVIGSGTFPCVIQKTNGNLLLAYLRYTDGYLVTREFTSSWSSESVVVSSQCFGVCIRQKKNGNILIVYQRSSSLYSKEYSSGGWSSESQPIVTGGYPNFIEKQNGNIFLVYTRANTDGYLCSKEYSGSWSSESIILSYRCLYPRVVIRRGVFLTVLYMKDGQSYIFSKENLGSTWSAENTLIGPNVDTPDIIEKTNGNLFFMFRDTLGSTFYLKSQEKPLNTVAITVSGHVDTPMELTLAGPALNPKIVNDTTKEYIRINYNLASGDYFVVNTEQGRKSVRLESSGIVSNGTAFFDAGSTFFDLKTGVNYIYFEDDNQTSTATGSITHTERYIGC